MALEDFVNELASHQFADLLHFHVSQPTRVTGALARSILESRPAMNRTLTTAERGFLSTLVAELNAGNFTVRDFEAAARLLEANWITQAQFRAVLGL